MRWLLNVAYMTLGEYPDQVPPEHLIPLESFKSEFDIRRFTDLARKSRGQSARPTRAARSWMISTTTVCWISLRQPWIPEYRWPSTATGATARSRTAPRRPASANQLGGLNCVQTDYNNDGRLDIFVCAAAGRFPMRHSPFFGTTATAPSPT